MPQMLFRLQLKQQVPSGLAITVVPVACSLPLPLGIACGDVLPVPYRQRCTGQHLHRMGKDETRLRSSGFILCHLTPVLSHLAGGSQG